MANISKIFREQFGQAPQLLVRAPGRINIIGEHTDYNNGYVLPAAIDKAIWLAASPRSDKRFAFYAADLGEVYITDNNTPFFQEEKKWSNYLLGAISELQKTGAVMPGVNIAFGGDIPLGAGLSSSAALESGVLFLLNELFQLGLSRIQIVQLAQRGENNFVGMQCGIMDMFASVMGREEAVVRLDCRSLEYAYFPFKMDGYSLVLCDSGVKHALVDSEYNTRRKECEAGIKILQQADPGIQSLRDVTPGFLAVHEAKLPPVVAQRCRYVTGEIARVEAACEALQNGQMEQLGALMFETHLGLQHDYQVSCPEMDFLVDTAREWPDVLGARMMGGGFGGCTINLVRAAGVEAFTERISAAYQAQYQLHLKTYPVRLMNGTSVEKIDDTL